jgi:hypothetical protein
VETGALTSKTQREKAGRSICRPKTHHSKVPIGLPPIPKQFLHELQRIRPVRQEIGLSNIHREV